MSRSNVDGSADFPVGSPASNVLEYLLRRCERYALAAPERHAAIAFGHDEQSRSLMLSDVAVLIASCTDPGKVQSQLVQHKLERAATRR